MSEKLDFPEISGSLDELSEQKLRKENLELRTKLHSYEKLLKDNGLLEKLSQLSDAEIICHGQIAQYKEIDAKGIPFELEDVKKFEILVKTLMLAQGKAPVVVEEKKTKKVTPDVATLLKLASTKGIKE